MSPDPDGTAPDATTTDTPTAEPATGATPRGRRILKVVVLLVVAVLWVRIVLFEFVFPYVERYVDNPELEGQDEPVAPEDTGAPDDPTLGLARR